MTGRRGATIAAAACALAAGAVVPARGADVTRLTVDPTHALDRVNAALGGLGWVSGSGPAVAELRPPLVRIDASLQAISPDPDTFRIEPLLDEVAAARAIGAEPLVILSYTPAWMSESRAYGRDPTKIAPADLDVWQRLVHRVVTTLATAAQPATWFEAWNEPDVPIFWQDLPSTWVDTVERSARAVAQVQRETGIRLRFGGPATAVPDPVYLAPFLARFRDRTLPLDFVSWHYYGNYPFLGPDGPEPFVPAVLHPAWPIVGRRNPAADPATFGGQVGVMRDWVAAGLAGSDRPAPLLILDEWNVSAGGFDRRNDTHEGAAFDAAVLMELQEARLDAAAFFHAADTYGGRAGDLGLVTTSGARKPAWWTFWLWQRAAESRRATRVPVAGADAPGDGLWAQASRAGSRLTVLVASFSASQPTPHDLELELRGVRGGVARVRRLDPGHASAERAERVRLDDTGTLRLHLPPQSVVAVEVDVPQASRRPIRTHHG